jgi:hypothetical protein
MYSRAKSWWMGGVGREEDQGHKLAFGIFLAALFVV